MQQCLARQAVMASRFVLHTSAHCVFCTQQHITSGILRRCLKQHTGFPNQWAAEQDDSRQHGNSGHCRDPSQGYSALRRVSISLLVLPNPTPWVRYLEWPPIMTRDGPDGACHRWVYFRHTQDKPLLNGIRSILSHPPPYLGRYRPQTPQPPPKK